MAEVQLRRLAGLRNEPSIEVRPTVALESVGSGSGRLVRPLEVGSPEGNIRFERGDVLFGKLRPYLAKSLVVSEPIHGSSEFLCMVPWPSLDPRFLHYVTLSTPFLQYAEASSYGLKMPRTSWEEIGSYRIYMLPLEEQRRIADFLDDQVKRINEAMSARNKQLSLLDARFDVTLKDLVLGHGSQSLRWAYGIGNDRVFFPLGRLVRRRGEKNYPVRVHRILSLTAKRGVIPYEEKGEIGNQASEDISRYSIVQPGDIVVNSMNVIIGSVGLSEHQGVLSPVYYVMKTTPDSPALPEFVALHFRVREFQQQLIRLGYGILEHRMRIPWINLKAELLAIPSLEHQRQIIGKVGSLDADRRESLSKIQSSIGMMEQRKRALITAAVTGALDVTTAKPAGLGKSALSVVSA